MSEIRDRCGSVHADKNEDPEKQTTRTITVHRQEVLLDHRTEIVECKGIEEQVRCIAMKKWMRKKTIPFLVVFHVVWDEQIFVAEILIRESNDGYDDHYNQ